MSRMTTSPRTSFLHIALLAAIATLSATVGATDALAQWSVNDLHRSSAIATEAIEQKSAGQVEDAMFRDGFGSNALSFTWASPQPNLVDVWAGTFASGDIDGDGDVDLFMSGITPARQAKLYLNDGTGNFSETGHPFPPSNASQAILRDLDGDSDLDLFFSGSGSIGNFTNIYRNNGSGVFIQVANSALPRIIKGADIADVDNDGDQDIVISSIGAADVYLNNGSAVFSAKGNLGFTPVNGVVRFIDLENDGDQDLIIAGRDANNAPSTKLYSNNGFGNFTPTPNATFAAVAGEDIDVIDTDKDGDLDVLLNGGNRNLLYSNNGLGVFTEVTTNLQQTAGGQNEFADFDNDGDHDLLIVGTQPGGLPNIFNIVYENKGNNVFTQAAVLGGEYIAACVVADFTGDGLKDVVIQGFVDQTNVYWNTSINRN